MSTLVAATVKATTLEETTSGSITVAKLLTPWELVESYVFSTSVATVDFETGFDDGYDHEFVYNNCTPDVSDSLAMRVKEAGAYISSAAAYRNAVVTHINTTASVSSSQQTLIFLSAGSAIGTAEQAGGRILSMNPGNALRTQLNSSGVGATAATATVMKHSLNFAEREAAAVCQGIRFFWTAGNNFAAGEISQYRRKRS